MKRIVVQEVAGPADESNAYLILCFVVLVAIVAIIGVICVIKRFTRKNEMRTVAQTVEHNVKGQPVKGDFLDIRATDEPQEDQQYHLRVNDVHQLGTLRPPTAESQSQNTAVDTARELLTDRDTAPVRIDEMRDTRHTYN